MAESARQKVGLLNLFYRYVKDNGTIIHAEFARDVEELHKYGSDLDVLQPTDSAIDTPSPFIELVY